MGMIKIKAKEIVEIEDVSQLKINPKTYDIMHKGEIQGKILADFYLIKLVRKKSLN